MSPLDPLRISSDGTQIENARDGSRFFYLADTGWELAHWLKRDEVCRYLDVRAGQGFNVIQMMALIEHDGLRAPNRYGDIPFVDLDPTRPSEPYWRHVDFVVQQANDRGLRIALLPIWGDKVTRAWGVGPTVFDEANASVYGRWIATRYLSAGMIWVIGGDRPVVEERDRRIWGALAEAIREVDPGRLMAFHPPGGKSSSHFFHNAPWLDFNMLQSGHTGRDRPNWEMISRDRALVPRKPVLDAEPNYEDHPVMAVIDGQWVHEGGWFDDREVRKQAYRAVLSGACGHTYGCQAVWQFYDPDLRPAINKPRKPWHESLDLPGASQMRHLLAFALMLDDRGGGAIEPNQGILADPTLARERQMVAATFANRRGGAIYTPLRQKVRLVSAALPGAVCGSHWFDPRTGRLEVAAGEVGVNTIEFDTPTDDDYALVFDCASAPM